MIKLHGEFEIDFPKITKLGMTDRQTDRRKDGQQTTDDQ